MKKLLFIATLFISLLSTAQEEFGDGMYAIISTDKGEIIISLEHKKVPLTVASFVGLAEGDFEYDSIKIDKPFFNGLKFHRVINDFMIQGGDPTGTGSGNPGYFFQDEFDTSLTHSGPGILSMANSGSNTNGSQFFITHKATPWLNMKHSVFGHVVKGQDVVNAIVQDDIMETVQIVRIGKEAKKFNATKVFNESLEIIKREQVERIAKEKQAFKEKWIVTYPKMVQTETGLMYEHTKQGEGNSPRPGDEIHIHYTGYLEDGTQFESSHDRTVDLKIIFKEQPIFSGWEEAFAMMKPGGTMKVVLPPWLGFGDQGKGQVPPNAHLVFDLELIGVKDVQAELKIKNDEFKTEMLAKYPTAVQTESGLMYIIEQEGTGAYPRLNQEVEVHYTGWLTNGTKFDSSRDRNTTFKFPLGQGRVIKGWDEGIAKCKIGGKIKLIIPHWLAYGATARPSIPAESTLIFDVELFGAI